MEQGTSGSHGNDQRRLATGAIHGVAFGRFGPTGDLAGTNKARAKIKIDWVEGNGATLRGNAPLWYYILSEAEYYGVTNDPAVAFGGQHLGPAGSRIVAETSIGLLWLDKASFLHDRRGFQPMKQVTRGPNLTLAVLMECASTP